MITSQQIRAGRGLLGWKQTDLARRSGISEISIKNIERGITDPRASTLRAIQEAFQKGGLDFIEPGQSSPGGGIGLRLRK